MIRVLGLLLVAAVGVLLWAGIDTGEPVDRSGPASAEDEAADPSVFRGESPAVAREEEAPSSTPEPASAADPDRPAGEDAIGLVVRDAAGGSAGKVPLTMRTLGAGGPGDPFSRSSDGRGRVVLRPSAFDRSDATELEVAPALPGLEEHRWQVGLRPPPTEPVELRLPPTGSVQVTLRGADGRPPERPHSILLRIATDPGGRHTSATTGTGGKARFAHVPLGTRVLLNTRIDGQRLEKEVAGPDRQGGVVEATLDARPAPVLVGRLLEGAQPAGTVQGRLFLGSNDDEPDRPPRFLTDDGGRFRIGLPPEAAGRHSGTIRLRVIPDRVAECPGRTLVAGVLDLGDLDLRRIHALLSGRFEGPGELGAHLGVHHRRNGRWAHARDLEVVRDGPSFAVHGKAPAGELRLVVHAPEYAPVPPIPVTPGDHGIVIHLEEAGKVQVDIAFADAARVHRTLVPELRPVGHHGREQMVDGVRDARLPDAEPLDSETIRYRWSGLWPGRYELVVDAWGTSRPLAVVSDVVVNAGETTTLEPIDLRATRLIHLELRGLPDDLPPAHRRHAGLPEGFPGDALGHGFVYVEEDGRRTDQAFVIAGDHVLLATDRPLDLVVEAWGCRRVRLRDVFEDRVVRLEPAPGAELTAAVAEEVLPEGTALEVFLLPEDAGDLGRIVALDPESGQRVPHPGEAIPCGKTPSGYSARVPAPGDYRMIAWITLPGAEPFGVPFRPDPLTIGPDGIRTEVTLDAATLRAVLAAHRKKQR